MIHDEHDVEESELIEMGKRRIARQRERLRQLSIRRGDVTPERGARVLKPKKVVRKRLTPTEVPTADAGAPVPDPHLVMTRRVNPDPEPAAAPTSPLARVPTLDLRPGRTLPRHLPAPTSSADDIARLYSEFVAAVRLCSKSYPKIDLETFSRRITRQRELAKKRHQTQALRMRVEVVDDRPVIFIRPR